MGKDELVYFPRPCHAICNEFILPGCCTYHQQCHCLHTVDDTVMYVIVFILLILSYMSLSSSLFVFL